MENLFFNEKEISIIDKNLGFIVMDWAKHLVNHILSQARQKGVESIYMNSPETLDSGANEGKVDYFYTKLPQQLGFKPVVVNLRGKGNENMWVYKFDNWMNTASSGGILRLASLVPMDKIPRKYQGAFIKMIWRKDAYTNEEISHVLSILEKSAKQPKQPKQSLAKFYYDWDSKEWSGGQRFTNISEKIVIQKLPIELQNYIAENETLLKFWSFLLSQPSHSFLGNDSIGFALLSMISNKAWVINEIQTDCIQAYHKIRSSYYKEKGTSKKMTWETLKDMLEGGDRSNWIQRLEVNVPLREQIINNPNIINQLPDNSQNIDEWMRNYQRDNGAANQGLNLMQHFQSVNFNTRIYKIR
jgi:hypothetical protein